MKNFFDKLIRTGSSLKSEIPNSISSEEEKIVILTFLGMLKFHG